MSADIAMQTRCIYCLREQYGPAVHAISHGEHPCNWCGRTHEPPLLSLREGDDVSLLTRWDDWRVWRRYRRWLRSTGGNR